MPINLLCDWQDQPDPEPASPSPQDLGIPDEAYGARTAAQWLQPGEQLDPASQREANTANATRAEELNNQYIDRQQAILSTGPDAFFNTRGRDALLGADDAIGRLDTARQEVLDQAATPQQRYLLKDALDQHRLVEHYDIGTHVGQQARQWRQEVAQGRLDRLKTQAGLDYDDPSRIAGLAQASENSAGEWARLAGLGADQARSHIDATKSGIWRSAIEAALAK